MTSAVTGNWSEDHLRVYSSLYEPSNTYVLWFLSRTRTYWEGKLSRDQAIEEARDKLVNVLSSWEPSRGSFSAYGLACLQNHFPHLLPHSQQVDLVRETAEDELELVTNTALGELREELRSLTKDAEEAAEIDSIFSENELGMTSDSQWNTVRICIRRRVLGQYGLTATAPANLESLTDSNAPTNIYPLGPGSLDHVLARCNWWRELSALEEGPFHPLDNSQ